MKEAIKEIRAELKRLQAFKRQEKRWSVGWHRIDGAQGVLRQLLWQLEFLGEPK